MRPGFGDDADERGQQDHQRNVGADPGADIHQFRDESQRDQDTEGPGEDLGHVTDNDMMPQMLFHEVVGAESRDTEHDDADGGEDQIHPVFAQQVEAAVFGLFHAFVLVFEHAAGQRIDIEADAEEKDGPFPGEEMPLLLFPCFFGSGPVLVFVVYILFVETHLIAGFQLIRL